MKLVEKIARKFAELEDLEPDSMVTRQILATNGRYTVMPHDINVWPAWQFYTKHAQVAIDAITTHIPELPACGTSPESTSSTSEATPGGIPSDSLREQGSTMLQGKIKQIQEWDVKEQASPPSLKQFAGVSRTVQQEDCPPAMSSLGANGAVGSKFGSK